MDDRPDSMNKSMAATPEARRMSMTSRILPLPEDAVTQIHSSKQITSLQGVVLSLLENSLDGEASKVDVSFSSSRGVCTIEDNGKGIPSREFRDTGGLGKMYHTSKANSSQGHEVHGSTGSYLTSLSALSLLNVTSRHADEGDTATLTLHQGRVLARQIPANEPHGLTSHGTSVSVKDLFGNMPVRVKQRALASDTGPTGDEKTWHDLKYGIAALLLAWRSPCSVKLRDADVAGKTLTLAGSHPSVSAALTEKSLNQLLGKSTRYDLRDALPVVFQAGLAPYETRSQWVPISASTLQLSVHGSICLDPAPTKGCQFVSIGVRPRSAVSGYGEIYESVNRIFANSSFGSLEEEAQPDEAERDRRKRDRRYKVDGYTQKQMRGGKGIDRWPMFVLQVKLRDQSRTTSVAQATSDHQLKNITDVLEAMVEQWLAANNFRPRKRRRRRNEEQSSPAVTSTIQSPAATGTAVYPATVSARPSSSRRIVTADGSLPPREKRRIIDLSEPNARANALDSHVLQANTATPNSWSRIKSGREKLVSGLGAKGKPYTAPAGFSGSVSVAPGLRNGFFRLPTLEAGSLSSRIKKPVTRGEISATLRQPIDAGHPGGEAVISSDYFGSMSDGELLNAAEATEQDYSMAALPPHPTAEADAFTDDDIVDWTKPVTRQVFRVNSRTGVVLPADSRGASDTGPNTGNIRRAAAINTATTSAGRPLTLSRRGKPTDGSTTNTLPKQLRDWQNPVFAHPREAQIPIASLSGPGTETSTLSHHRCSQDTITSHFAGSGASSNIKLTKTDLARAKVIAQVDRKFILANIPSPTTSIHTLILIDQHAASERILLENLLTDLCAPISPTSATANLRTNTGQTSSITTTLLPTPSHFAISAQEHALLASRAPHFASWGMLYDLSPASLDATPAQTVQAVRGCKVSVRALPPVIAERCGLFPKLVTELLRSEIYALAQYPTSTSTKSPSTSTKIPPSRPNPPLPPGPRQDTDAEPPHWLHLLPSCPKALRAMLASRACRSAVMFNDVLSLQECEGLVGALAGCVFPFVCAHGRVGIVPVVELGGGEGDGGGLGGFGGGRDFGESVGVGGGREEEGNREGYGEGFKEAWRRWRQGRGVDTRAEIGAS